MSAKKNNHLLAALTWREFTRLELHLQLTEFTPGQVIFSPGDSIDALYFPVGLAASITAVGRDGESINLAIVGSEGVLGFSGALGEEKTPYEVVALNQGAAYRLRRELADWEFQQNSGLMRVLLGFGSLVTYSFAQLALCNQRHAVGQRLCAWLLDVSEAAGRTTLEMTQVFMAGQLGVRREAVGEAALELQNAGLIRYSRGTVELLDREGLRHRACSCRANIRKRQVAAFRSVDSAEKFRDRPAPATIRQLAAERATRAMNQLPASLSGIGQLVAELEVSKHLNELQLEELTESYAEADRLREKYSDLYDFAPVAYASVDRQAVIRQINIAGAMLLNLKRSEVSRHRFTDSVAPAYQEAFAKFLADVISQPGTNRIQVDLVSGPQQRLVTALIDATADESGSECRLAITDISERMLLEKRLQDAFAESRLLKHALDQVDAYVFLKDRELKYRYANRRVLDTLGCTVEALIGRDDSPFVPPELARHLQDQDRRALAGEKVVDETLIRHPDGHLIHTRDIKTPVHEDDGPGPVWGLCGVSTEITDLKRIEAALRESEERFRALIHATSDIVYRMSADWMEMRQLVGHEFVPDTEKPSRYWVDTYIPQQDQELVLSAIHEAMFRKGTFELEHRIIRTDGSIGWTFSRAVPMLGADGEITEWIGMASDITERKASDAALKDSNRLLEMAQQAANAGAWARDLVTGEVNWSDNLYRIFGLDPNRDTVTADTWRSFVHPDDLARVEAHVAEAMADPHKPINVSTRIRLADGTVRWLDILGDTEYDADARPLRSSGFVIDASRRIDLESRLNLWSQAFEKSEINIAIMDVESNRMIAVNPAFARRRGYAQDELIGKSLSMIIPQSKWELVDAHSREASQQPHFVVEGAHVCKDGTVFPILADLSVIREPTGKPLARLAFVIDITQQKAQERELELYRENLERMVIDRTRELRQATLAAKAADVAKSTFVANMSHEIRTPLNAINGMAYMLEKDGLTPEQAESVQTLKDEAYKLLEMFDSIIEISQLEAEKMRLRAAPIDVPAIVSHVLESIGNDASAKSIRVNTQIGELPDNLAGDSAALEEVIYRYMSNAVKFTPQGEIQLNISLAAQDEHSALLKCEVIDTGIGISQEHIPRLFQLFEQVDNSPTRRFGGAGLGLAIARKLVELMEGETGVTSSPGVGSRFWFSVKLLKRQAGLH